MGQEGDDIVSLPVPPPPRPAARREAIDAALRKFDGIEESPGRRKASSQAWWATMHRRPAGALVTAALIALISVPAIQIVLRDHPTTEAPPAAESITAQPAPPSAPSEIGQAQADEEVAAAKAPSAEPTTPSPAASSSVAAEERSGFVSPSRIEKSGIAAPAPVITAPASPPLLAAPPPPPPPAEPEAQRNDQGAAYGIVVTGSRVRRSNLESAAPVNVVGDHYGEFLLRLQASLSAYDRRAVTSLIGFPLRVTFGSESRTYRSRQDIERDFDRVFTPAVRQAVLALRSDTLMSRDGGRLRGNDRIWFGCPRKSCSSESSIRIREVNP